MTQNNDNDTFALPKENEEAPFIQEEFPQVDPNQVEKELLEQYKEMQDNMPAEDVAAHFWQMYFPMYKQLLGTLSNKDARRVAEHVVQWPLEDQDPKFNDEKARAAWQVGIRLIDCKMIMKSVVEMERLQLAQEAKLKAAEAANNTSTETSVENKGEETNG